MILLRLSQKPPKQISVRYHASTPATPRPETQWPIQVFDLDEGEEEVEVVSTTEREDSEVCAGSRLSHAQTSADPYGR